mgnify:CR=1 FL=1
MPIEKAPFLRKSPLAPYPALIAAPISPTPGTHSRRPDQAEKRKKAAPRDRGAAAGHDYLKFFDASRMQATGKNRIARM